MFNLDAFADSMKESVPKKMSFTLDDLINLRSCIDSVIVVIDYVQSFGIDRSQYEFDDCVLELMSNFGLDVSHSDSSFSSCYENLTALRNKLNSFSFN